MLAGQISQTETGRRSDYRDGLDSFDAALIPKIVAVAAPPSTAIDVTVPRPKMLKPPPAAPAALAPETAATADAVTLIVAVDPAVTATTGDKPMTAPVGPTTSTT